MFNKEKAILVIYAFVFLIVLLALKAFIYPELFATNNFLNWDAEHYYWIKNFGYEGFRVAFFPLFPLFCTMNLAIFFSVSSLLILGITS